MKDNVALVTGGAGYIGQEVCKMLASDGVAIAVVDKNIETGRSFIDQLKSEYGIDGLFLDIDLIDSESFHKISSKVDTYFGRLDFVVNNAAFYDKIPGWDVPFEQESYEAWLQVMRVNLMAPFFLVQSLKSLLSQSKVASIVNIISTYGVVAPDHSLYKGLDMNNPAAYAASKGGLLQLTKWLSTVLAPTIRVNAVTPGGVERDQDGLFIQRYNARTPLARMANEQDIANAIIFLLSTKSSYMTGHNLVVDGGWTVW